MKTLFAILTLAVVALFILVLYFAMTAPGWVLVPLGICVAAFTARMIWQDM